MGAGIFQEKMLLPRSGLFEPNYRDYVYERSDFVSKEVMREATKKAAKKIGSRMLKRIN